MLSEAELGMLTCAVIFVIFPQIPTPMDPTTTRTTMDPLTPTLELVNPPTPHQVERSKSFGGRCRS
jgi:hypothetical protein